MTIERLRPEAPVRASARSDGEPRRLGMSDHAGTRVRVGPCVLRRAEVPAPCTVIDPAPLGGVAAVRLIAVQAGHVSLLGVDDTRVALGPGDATFAGRGATYRVGAPGTVLLSSTVPIDALPAPARRMQDGPIRPLPRTPLLEALVGTMCELADRGVDVDPIASEYAGLGLINLQASLLIGPSSGMRSPSGPECVYQRALAHIEDHLFDPELRPPAIAESLRVSLRYLHLAFERQETSVTLQIRDRRLAALQTALRDRHQQTSLDELARRFGFVSSGAMSRQFRERSGVPVSVYRRSAATPSMPRAT